MIEVVAAIIKNQEEEILIAKRKEGKVLAGFWEFPGGKVEEGEEPEISLQRELLEEMNLQIQVEAYYATNIHDYGNIKIKLIAYLAKILMGDMQLKDHDEVLWIKPQELQNYVFAPADVPFVKQLIEETNIDVRP
ncbi:ADP-ribose pyrophosphatase [Clostridium aceticum]|uniref:8-oxo-dGTP diphosphatase n=1 Tax=Clostridium aceticum TaxID=84022 RepID=A0A0D8IEW4_9CLOT|nr:(deoxy)nucleoside triphosphate pyrophosphohydrolase [Clostridium aceticum]AKL94815.1 ADP-ribose pyrophosphatase [Clostridium aceticum]KJF27751.1 NUDIX hydrolase [Clostridium aceticum]